MREYTFKPAIARREQVWAIQDGHLMRRGGASAIDLAHVQGAIWGDMAYRGTRTSWLHLEGEEAVTKIECNDSGVGEDRSEFLALIEAICAQLAEVQPDLPVRQGGGRALKWSLFLIGLMGGALGLVFVWAGLTGNVVRGEALAIIFGGLMAASLFYLAYQYLPWRTDTVLTPAQMRRLVQDLGAVRTPL